MFKTLMVLGSLLGDRLESSSLKRLGAVAIILKEKNAEIDHLKARNIMLGRTLAGIRMDLKESKGREEILRERLRLSRSAAKMEVPEA